MRDFVHYDNCECESCKIHGLLYSYLLNLALFNSVSFDTLYYTLHIVMLIVRFKSYCLLPAYLTCSLLHFVNLILFTLMSAVCDDWGSICQQTYLACMNFSKNLKVLFTGSIHPDRQSSSSFFNYTLIHLSSTFFYLLLSSSLNSTYAFQLLLQCNIFSSHDYLPSSTYAHVKAYCFPSLSHPALRSIPTSVSSRYIFLP